MPSSTLKSSIALIFTTSVAGASALMNGCGTDKVSEFDPGTKDSNVSAPDSYKPSPLSDSGDGTFTDFPSDPILDQAPANPAANIASEFAAAEGSAFGGPCLMEPEIGSVYPRNWLRPRFRWISDNGLAGGNSLGNVFEIRLHVENQQNDLVVYTTATSWTMPQAMWEALRNDSAGSPMTLTIRQGTYDGTTLKSVSSGAGGPISIAPVDAPGTVVYWTTAAVGASSGTYNPVLKGFRIGDGSVQVVARPSTVQVAGTSKCIGCHSSTPDGNFVGFSYRDVPEGDGTTYVGFSNAKGADAGKPSYMTSQAETLLSRHEQEKPVFTKAHYQQGDRVAISLLRSPPSGFDIIWTDLETTSVDEGTGWGKFARTNDPKPYAALASASHDGKSIVYVSTDTANTAGTIVTNGELRTIPYNARKGGDSTEVVGANTAGYKQFYPEYSPDDRFIAYNRSPVLGTDGKTRNSYADPSAEVYVIPSAGGTSKRIAANDPPACSGAKSPGVFNSWPKWSPSVRTADGKDYYFVVFSSARNNGTARFGARLYVTTLIVENGVMTTTPALYLWNQPSNEDNHSPSWDELAIPRPN